MTDRAASSITIAAPPEQVIAVIADFEAYPAWTGQVKQVDVLARDDRGRGTEVRLRLDAGVLRDDYTLAYDWSEPGALSWHLVRGQLMKAQDGTYRLRAVEGGTEVRYELAVELAVPMLGMLKRKAEKAVIDAALKGLKKRVEAGAGTG